MQESDSILTTVNHPKTFPSAVVRLDSFSLQSAPSGGQVLNQKSDPPRTLDMQGSASKLLGALGFAAMKIAQNSHAAEEWTGKTMMRKCVKRKPWILLGLSGFT